MTDFDAAVVAAVTAHMNDDHADDSLLIVRAFAEPGATRARMTGVDSESGEWTVEIDGRDRTVRIPWIEPVTDRAGLRTAVVDLYKAACVRLGVDTPS
ncbi:DUF2470 domain-containing protein [Rhodococcus sp. Z13]|uniref:DUF2470 domain-containing protein n=1 Tax=Rhodococcus sacchari TaxID=2962047 RepID=A0ACD4DBP9_9NOCA|nr:DUF2470 domain-containing protein [Rhodococcus sp. Z13]UYP17412.1 DUF2470 domain-containing protein [Rhodococcus sp. Z13]